jgi:hypothetical protein
MASGEATWLKQYIDSARQEFHDTINRTAGGLRKQNADHTTRVHQSIDALGAIAKSLQISRAGGSGGGPGGSAAPDGGFTWYNKAGIARIEDIPGRRVPFDLLVDIPIGGGAQTSLLTQGITIPQEGPFVAEKRIATFISNHQFQITVEQAVARFSSRSFGRYRPISSVGDLLDAQSGAIVTTQNPMVVGTTVGVPELPSSMSGFRTMELDGRITVVNAGSSFPRQNISVPTPFWAQGLGGAFFELGALDFFERAEVINFSIQPTHENNPPAGNVDGDGIFGIVGAWPFLAGQYDKHEGILTPNAFTVSTVSSVDIVAPITTDPVVRLPNGILTIGYHGYMIQQPVGPV